MSKMIFIFLFKQKTAYEMRISDWSSDVCSSDLYAAAPKSIIAIGDGGFLWWSGLLAALAFAWWRSGKRPALRRPLLGGIAAGMLAWAMFNGLLVMMQRSAPAPPTFELATPDGQPPTLAALSGRPLGLTLWGRCCGGEEGGVGKGFFDTCTIR